MLRIQTPKAMRCGTDRCHRYRQIDLKPQQEQHWERYNWNHCECADGSTGPGIRYEYLWAENVYRGVQYRKSELNEMTGKNLSIKK
jgi:hypothetical protein